MQLLSPFTPAAPVATPGVRPAGGPPSNEFAPGATVDNGQGVQYRIIKELGAGCFGRVCKVQRLSDGKTFAMKLQMQRDAAQVAEVRKEVGFLRRLRHQNVVSFFEDFQFRRYICIVMEFCDGGTLHKHIESRKQRGFSVLRVASYLIQLANGLEFIHGQNVTHRDLKSENVMMTSQMEIKISDFGCGKALAPGHSAELTMTGGDRMIVPPEMAHRIQGIPQHGMVGPAYDMWGLGVILSEMVTLKLMTKDICRQAPLSVNRNAEAQILQEARQAHGGRFFTILQGLLQHDPAKRMTAPGVKAAVRSIVQRESKPDPQHLQKAALKLGVPESQLAEAWQHFVNADSGNKGNITLGELKSILTVNHIDVSARALMKQFDKESTGTMDFAEFARFWLSRNEQWMPTVLPGNKGKDEINAIHRVHGIPPAEYLALSEAFIRMDVDQSGDITASQLWALMAEIGVKMGGDYSQFVRSLGPDAQDRNYNFDEILRWSKDNVDWRTKVFTPPVSSPLGRRPKSPPGGGRPSNVSPPPPSSSGGQSGHQNRPSSSSGRSNQQYRLHDRVLVMRSNGQWSPAEVTEVKAEGLVVTYTQDDKGSTKEIHNLYAEKFIRPA
eukprot:EG_transcript_4230